MRAHTRCCLLCALSMLGLSHAMHGCCCSGDMFGVSLRPADGRALAGVLPHCAQLQDVRIGCTRMVWLLGCLASGGCMCACFWVQCVHQPLRAVVVCWLQMHTSWSCMWVPHVSTLLTTFAWFHACWLFAGNGMLGTDTMQAIVDALPHACMQRLDISRALPASLCLLACSCVVTHPSTPSACSGVLWLGHPHTVPCACGRTALFLLPFEEGVGLLVAGMTELHGVRARTLWGVVSFRDRHHRSIGVSTHVAMLAHLECLRCVLWGFEMVFLLRSNSQSCWRLWLPLAGRACVCVRGACLSLHDTCMLLHSVALRFMFDLTIGRCVSYCAGCIYYSRRLDVAVHACFVVYDT